MDFTMPYTTIPDYDVPQVPTQAPVGVSATAIARNDAVYDDSHMPVPPQSGNATLDYLTGLASFAYMNTRVRTRRPDGSVGGPNAGAKDAATLSPAFTANSEGGGKRKQDVVGDTSSGAMKNIVFGLVAGVLVYVLWSSVLAALVVAVLVFLAAKMMGWGS